nr:unnamed protein product [Digitaria exilis]
MVLGYMGGPLFDEATQVRWRSARLVQPYVQDCRPRVGGCRGVRGGDDDEVFSGQMEYMSRISSTPPLPHYDRTRKTWSFIHERAAASTTSAAAGLLEEEAGERTDAQGSEEGFGRRFCSSLPPPAVRAALLLPPFAGDPRRSAPLLSSSIGSPRAWILATRRRARRRSAGRSYCRGVQSPPALAQLPAAARPDTAPANPGRPPSLGRPLPLELQLGDGELVDAAGEATAQARCGSRRRPLLSLGVALINHLAGCSPQTQSSLSCGVWAAEGSSPQPHTHLPFSRRPPAAQAAAAESRTPPGCAMVVMGKLGVLIGPDVSLLWKFKDDLESIRSTLLTLQAVLNDAEKRSSREERVRLWLKRLKFAAYDIHDILEEMESKNDMQDTVRGIALQKVSQFRAHIPIARKMKKVRQRATFSSISEDIVGRAMEKETIVAMLMAYSEEEILTISIYGFGGLGKTTLARLAFNDENVRRVFDYQVWVYVSMKFDLKKIGESILSEIDGGNCGHANLQEVSRHIQRVLASKKFLVVLDDLWEENGFQLLKLKEMLSGGAKGSKIIVTTRSEKIASLMRPCTPYKLDVLSDDDCWILFKRRAFVPGMDDPRIEGIGRDIVKKCNVFSKGVVIDKDMLIQQWIALGFIQPASGSLTLEKRGEEYIHELVSMSFLQASMISSLLSHMP